MGTHTTSALSRLINIRQTLIGSGASVGSTRHAASAGRAKAIVPYLLALAVDRTQAVTRILRHSSVGLITPISLIRPLLRKSVVLPHCHAHGPRARVVSYTIIIDAELEFPGAVLII